MYDDANSSAVTISEPVPAAVDAMDPITHTLERAFAAPQVYQTLLDNMLQGVCMYDAEQRLVATNERFAQMYRLPLSKLAPGTSLRDVMAMRIMNGLHAGASAEQYVAGRADQKLMPTDVIEELADGRSILVRRRLLAGGGWVATHEDVTERRRTEARIAHLATHDALTDLPNRILLAQKLELALQRVRRGDSIALLWIDLDRFKQVNDVHGHPVGDLLLKGVAQRLRTSVRDLDTVARLGGDEFAVIQVPAPDAASVACLAERLIHKLSNPYMIDGQQIIIGCSIGISIATAENSNPEALMHQADLALYQAKADGRGSYRYFESGMDQNMKKKRQLEADLTAALVREEFELYYQPIMQLARMRVSGFEALLRWEHPKLGRMNPMDFIPVAEETGLIVPIGSWVLRRACLDAMSWPAHISVAVNLSAIHFKTGDPFACVRSALEASGLPPQRLEIEITESTLIENAERTLEILSDLKSLGVRISMDDFGTGYSSLSYLSRFPFDKIKIDRAFIKDLPDARQSLAILRSVTSLGTNLGMTTTAEGVETFDQLNIANEEGCSEVQGYYFSPARPQIETLGLIEECARRAEAALGGRTVARPRALFPAVQTGGGN